MGGDLSLSHNAHRLRELAELLLQGSRTVTELAGALGATVNDAEHILARLRKNSLPVATLDVGDDDPLFRILCPKGRVCAAEGRPAGRSRGAPTRLNTAGCTEGGVLRLRMALAAPRGPRPTPPIRSRSPSRGSMGPPCAPSGNAGASASAGWPPWRT